MTGWIDLVNYTGVIAGLTIALLSFLVVLFNRYLDEWNRRFFILFFLVMICYIASDLLSQISLNILGNGFVWLSKTAVFLESMFSALLIPMLSIFLLHCAGEDWRGKALTMTNGILWGLYMAELIVTQFTTLIYYFTPDNVYHRGPYYPVLLVPTVLLMIINLIALIRRRKNMADKEFRGFLLYFLIPVGCMLIQMFVYALLMIVLGTSLAALCLFIYILSEQTDQYVRQQQENSNQRLNIAILQMRPHFIYNTMTSIYYLVRQDAGKAQQVIQDFTNYLRKNFTAIATNELILFAEELEHTRAYLSVEQVRFEGKLFVKYDTKIMNFRLPPLTLQPIVENAVKHGVDPEQDPVLITIRTRAMEGQVEVVVEDTGSAAQNSGEEGLHVALQNIQDRLRLMCDGTLSTTPRESGGTVVTVRIPLREEQ